MRNYIYASEWCNKCNYAKLYISEWCNKCNYVKLYISEWCNNNYVKLLFTFVTGSHLNNFFMLSLFCSLGFLSRFFSSDSSSFNFSLLYLLSLPVEPSLCSCSLLICILHSSSSTSKFHARFYGFATKVTLYYVNIKALWCMHLNGL